MANHLKAPAMLTETLPIPGGIPGTSHNLTVHRFGVPGARPKIYIQGALHADEIPGMIAAVKLRDLLLEAEAKGAIKGEIVLVPMANPIGLGQAMLGTPIGRFDFRDGRNFNRGYPYFTPDLIRLAETHLTDDEADNDRVIRSALRDLAAAMPADTEAGQLKKILTNLSIDADIVLDLHCDGEASVHLYTLTPLEPDFRPLAQLLGADAVLLSEDSGDDPFDEVSSRPWNELRRHFPDRPIPQGCISTTVELRGRDDVAEDLAEADAAALFAFLVLRGAAAGKAPDLPELASIATPLSACEPLIAPVGGIVLHRRAVGGRVEPGEALFDIVDPLTGSHTAVSTEFGGIYFARTLHRFAAPGQRLGKVAGTTMKRSGNLLTN